MLSSLLRGFSVAFTLLALSAWSNAALVTTQEAALDDIFSQASFGADTIDIRFNAQQSINSAAFLTIDNESELLALFAQANDFPAVNLYFVDAVNYCGSYNVAIVGCAARPGNDLVVESGIAAGALGAELIAHELGHNLGLGHPSGTGNLMNGSLNGSTFLTSAQVTSILDSPLIQLDGAQRYLSITPYLVEAAAVPLPAAAPFMFSALSALFILRRRKNKR